MEKKDRKLQIYTLVLKDDAEDSGVNYVALVDEPAIEQNWFAFAKESPCTCQYCSVEFDYNSVEEKGMGYIDCPNCKQVINQFGFGKMKFSMDTERKIITGPLMIADLPIYRRSEKMGEFYVIFDKGQIELMVQKFFKMGYQSNVNEQHDPSKLVDGVTMFESFIVDEQRGILPPKGFEKATQGSWFGSYKVDNEAIWAKVKDGSFMGFSVEGMFDLVPQKPTLESEIISIIESIQE